MHHFERCALIEDMLRRAMVRREAVLPAIFHRHRIEIYIECQRSKIAIDVDAIIFKAKFFVQVARGGTPGTARVDIDLEFIVGWKWTPKGVKQPSQQSP